MSSPQAGMLVTALLALVAGGGCAALDDRKDYYRHSMSDLREDWRRPGTMVFEASTSTLYPADSEAAEATRMEWLAGWMKQSGYCPAGWEVLSRSVIDPMEVHARRHDLRYDVTCAEPPQGRGH
jgi:hypothetical protein